jgi:alginate O-acetyltransferase complex protein AlgI
LFIVMIGWALFRSEQPSHLLPFLSALFGMSQGATVLEVPAEVPLALLIGVLVSLFPATPLYPLLARAHQQLAWLRWVSAAALVLIYVLALARAFAVPFQPFIYFRF